MNGADHPLWVSLLAAAAKAAPTTLNSSAPCAVPCGFRCSGRSLQGGGGLTLAEVLHGDAEVLGVAVGFSCKGVHISAFFWTLPIALRGRARTKRISRGRLCQDKSSATWVMSCSARSSPAESIR